MTEAHPATTSPTDVTDKATWQRIVAEFQRPSTPRALWQVADTFIPYAALWVLIYFSLSISWWITIPLAVLAGAFLVRIFIIFHDCGHGSFFPSRRANDILGFISGVLTTGYAGMRQQKRQRRDESSGPGPRH